MNKKYVSHDLSILSAAILLTGCSGLFSGVYDEPEPDGDVATEAGTLYIDASSWTEWHYIDLPKVASKNGPGYNPSEAWETYNIPTQAVEEKEGKRGIYTYWFDVFGQGIGKSELRGFMPTAGQAEPQSWTFAVHRNNVRTNGCRVAETQLEDIRNIRLSSSDIDALEFEADSWSENEVWTIQSQMLSGIIGCQGLEINRKLSGWLAVEIPPMPPSFSLRPRIFILELADGTYGALRLKDYRSAGGTACCLTIEYEYPLEITQ